MWECVGVRKHLFVCVNERAEGDPLGRGCGARGAEVYAWLKDEVARRGEIATTYVTRTYCLGVCPSEGCTVASYPRGEIVRIRTIDEAVTLLDAPNEEDDDGLAALENLQREKVLALARRLKPGLTLEDVQNPHDFPELDDCDWHYEDGVLTGIQTVRTALRARKKAK
jgi:(2Fe-2S) ferredoxin